MTMKGIMCTGAIKLIDEGLFIFDQFFLLSVVMEDLRHHVLLREALIRGDIECADLLISRVMKYLAVWHKETSVGCMSEKEFTLLKQTFGYVWFLYSLASRFR